MKADSRKWFALAIVCVAQFMVILDVSIVNVALPSIQRGLHFSEENLLWVLNAYALIFGGFLMLGGRVADKMGRRRVFVVGVILFSVASLFCGLATSTGWLVTARAVQGLGAAILSPAALSILTVTFHEGPERNKALSIWGAIAGAGGAFGVLLGGILTQEFGWRWIFYVNVPIGSLVVLSSFFILTPSLSEDERRGFDIPGALTLTAGLVLMGFALVKSTSWGWASVNTIGTMAAAILLLAVFVVIEHRTTFPLVPLTIFTNRSLSVSNLVSLALGASIFSMFYFLSLYMQDVLGYSALRTGIGYLAIASAIIIAAGAARGTRGQSRCSKRHDGRNGAGIRGTGLFHADIAARNVSRHLASGLLAGRRRAWAFLRPSDHWRHEWGRLRPGGGCVRTHNDDPTNRGSPWGGGSLDNRNFGNNEICNFARPGASGSNCRTEPRLFHRVLVWRNVCRSRRGHSVLWHERSPCQRRHREPVRGRHRRTCINETGSSLGQHHGPLGQPETTGIAASCPGHLITSQ